MRIEQTSDEVSESQWKWSVWLEGSDEELDSVREVVYHLHPTFANPTVRQSDRATKFRLDASGWGTFVIKVEVRKEDDSTEWMRHRLRFSRSEPQVFVSASSSDQGLIDEVNGVIENLGISATSAQDVPTGEDLSSTIRQQIDRAKAFVLINGPTPSRWVMEEVETARSLGKPIVSIGPDTFYDTKDAVQIASVDELEDVIGKLPA